jgi:hypothetical protein
MLAVLFIFIVAVSSLLIGVAIGRFLFFRANWGEAMVANTITTHFQRPHVLLNNVTFRTENGSSQIDHLLIADTGIFIIETKHYSGWIFGHPNDQYWTQTIYHNKSKFLNPILQNYGHVKVVQSLFALPGDNFHAIVVFTGSAEFKTNLGPLVLRLSQLIPLLSADRPIIFNERKMAYIVGRIEMKRMRRSLETDEYHINAVRRRIQSRQKVSG